MYKNMFNFYLLAPSDCSMTGIAVFLLVYDFYLLFTRKFIISFPVFQSASYFERYLPAGLMHLVLAAYADPVVFTNVRKLRVIGCCYFAVAHRG